MSKKDEFYGIVTDVDANGGYIRERGSTFSGKKILFSKGSLSDASQTVRPDQLVKFTKSDLSETLELADKIEILD